MKHQNEREKPHSDFEISHWWPCSFIYSYANKGNQKILQNCHTTRSFNAGALKCKISHQCPGELLSLNWTHLMNKYIFLVIISKEKGKTNWDQNFCVGKLENANQPRPASPSRVKTKTPQCSRHQRAKLSTYFKHLLTGTNSTNMLQKIKSTKGKTNKEDGKKGTDLN